MAKDSNRVMHSHKSKCGHDMANGHRDIHNYNSKYNDDMVICKVQIFAVVHQQNNKTKTNETNKKTESFLLTMILTMMKTLMMLMMIMMGVTISR